MGTISAWRWMRKIVGVEMVSTMGMKNGPSLINTLETEGLGLKLKLVSGEGNANNKKISSFERFAREQGLNKMTFCLLVGPKNVQQMKLIEQGRHKKVESSH
jgi:hypothetical protein